MTVMIIVVVDKLTRLRDKLSVSIGTDLDMKGSFSISILSFSFYDLLKI